MSKIVRCITQIPTISRSIFVKFSGMLLIAIVTIPCLSLHAQINVYPHITAKPTGKRVIHSPDPLVSYRWAAPRASDNMETYILKPVKISGSKSFDMKNYRSNDRIAVNGMGDIRFDFGRVSAAWVEFDSSDLEGEVEMSISEYDQIPVYATNYPKRTLKPVKRGNTYRLELNPQLYEGVRFGWIHVRSFSRPWNISGIRLVCQIRPTNYNGSFNCSDTMLTRIWYTGAYTVKLNLLQDHFGAILMNRGDRISWTGDAHPAQAASMVAFGNYDFVKQNLVHTSTQSNGIRSYALYWVLSLLDYYRYTGDTATLESYIDNVIAKLDDAYKVYGTNPDLLFFGWDERLGAGFEHPNLPEPQNGYKMLSIRAWKEFASAMNQLDRKDLFDKYARYAEEKMQAIRKDEAWYRSYGLHASADAVNTGYLTAQEQHAVFKQSFTNRVNRISYSPFNQYFVIQAFSAMHQYDDGLDAIRDLWGGQIKYGGTTFFENYRPSWNAIIAKNGAVPSNQCGFTSLCHPWGAGVTKWLSEEILGIKPTSPGFESFQIMPHLGRTLTYVSGAVPTLKGEISASFNLLSGKCSFSVPAGTKGTIGIPKVEKRIKALHVNDVLFWDGNYHSIEGISGAYEDDEFVYLKDVQPGVYNLQVQYGGVTPKHSVLPEVFPATYIGKDYSTGGNWGGTYGKDGYELCNYDGDGKHRQRLPDYISSINYYKIFGNNLPLNKTWRINTTDKRALAPSSANGFPRNAACIYSEDQDQIGYTFTSTINIKEPKRYRVTLYFLDWDGKGRKLAVEAFDAQTSELVAPVQVIEHCENGAYITFEYNRSIKFRINPIRGLTPVLSGIFFDATQ
ncbi:hypothetical protein EOD41_18755 [Mucilaginibacter limnophilus]|uniref:Alpha-L-rhamnosidase C-terminal domain-containing protein n=2 Tax=Mucilaginibacter limnophilus TaxID=1932778 RepID=A0A437MI68_9SPHI|nr:hypothetical protein EOD41_18755 [Mucilaginibacter limnophilus]